MLGPFSRNLIPPHPTRPKITVQLYANTCAAQEIEKKGCLSFRHWPSLTCSCDRLYTLEFRADCSDHDWRYENFEKFKKLNRCYSDKCRVRSTLAEFFPPPPPPASTPTPSGLVGRGARAHVTLGLLQPGDGFTQIGVLIEPGNFCVTVYFPMCPDNHGIRSVVDPVLVRLVGGDDDQPPNV